jgi:type 1 fimbriae regulatory protein FimB/type 1 fimbriae regulatory protein FimE
MAHSLAVIEGTKPAPSIVLDTRREYLTEAEVERLIRAAENQRDRTMILVAYRHGLRVSELIGLQWSQIDLDAGRVRVRRAKGSDDSVQPLGGREVRGLRKLRRSQPVGSRFLFLTRLGGPMTRNSFYKMLEKAAAKAGLEGVHPHLLRHGCGFKLVNDGMDTLSLAAYLGHRQLANTRRYTKMSASRFENIWRD